MLTGIKDETSKWQWYHLYLRKEYYFRNLYLIEYVKLKKTEVPAFNVHFVTAQGWYLSYIIEEAFPFGVLP